MPSVLSQQSETSDVPSNDQNIDYIDELIGFSCGMCRMNYSRQ